jgi:hypothetical protein
VKWLSEMKVSETLTCVYIYKPDSLLDLGFFWASGVLTEAGVTENGGILGDGPLMRPASINIF